MAFYTGIGAPAGALGNTSDQYLDVQGALYYTKTSGGWGTGTPLSYFVCQTTTSWAMPALNATVHGVPVTNTSWAQVGALVIVSNGTGYQFMQVSAIGTGTFDLINLGGTIAPAAVLVGATVQLIGQYGVTNSQPLSIQVYTGGAFNYTIPPNAQILDVVLMGGGGGGGSGRLGAANSARCGGGGGGGGAYSREKFSVAILGGSGTVIPGYVGLGGAGGAAITTVDTNGNAGVTGQDTSFGGSGIGTAGTMLVARGGGGGGAGQTSATSTAGGGATGGQFAGQGGGTGQSAANGSAGSVSSVTGYGAAGGGGGGGISAAEAVFAGGAGGGIPVAAKNDTPPAGGAVQGGAGVNGHATGQYQPGGAGSGGGASNTSGTPGGTGGNGGNYGGGGGGGGAGTDSLSNSGAGGNGANGVVFIVALS